MQAWGVRLFKLLFILGLFLAGEQAESPRTHTEKNNVVVGVLWTGTVPKVGGASRRQDSTRKQSRLHTSPTTACNQRDSIPTMAQLPSIAILDPDSKTLLNRLNIRLNEIDLKLSIVLELLATRLPDQRWATSRTRFSVQNSYDFFVLILFFSVVSLLLLVFFTSFKRYFTF